MKTDFPARLKGERPAEHINRMLNWIERDCEENPPEAMAAELEKFSVEVPELIRSLFDQFPQRRWTQ